MMPKFSAVFAIRFVIASTWMGAIAGCTSNGTFTPHFDGGPETDAQQHQDAKWDDVDGRVPVDAGSTADAGSTMPDSGSPPKRVFEEVNGIVAVEAEHFASNDPNGTPRDWYLTTVDDEPGITPDPDPSHASTASLKAYLEGLPDTRVTHGDSLKSGTNFFNTPGTGPILTYRIQFNNPGTYYVWARAVTTGTEDNGIHAGLNGSWPGSGARMQWCGNRGNWSWSSAQRDSGGSACGVDYTITLDIPSAGEHEIQFSMREDGFEFDKFILVKDKSYSPSGQGPAERLAQ